MLLLEERQHEGPQGYVAPTFLEPEQGRPSASKALGGSCATGAATKLTSDVMTVVEILVLHLLLGMGDDEWARGILIVKFEKRNCRAPGESIVNRFGVEGASSARAWTSEAAPLATMIPTKAEAAKKFLRARKQVSRRAIEATAITANATRHCPDLELAEQNALASRRQMRASARAGVMFSCAISARPPWQSTAPKIPSRALAAFAGAAMDNSPAKTAGPAQVFFAIPSLISHACVRLRQGRHFAPVHCADSGL